MSTQPIKNAPVVLMRTEMRARRFDPRVVQPARNFGSRAQRRNMNEIFVDEPKNNVVWQPDVYFEAKQLADRLGLPNVIDLGCGDGSKLIEHFGPEAYETVGVDFLGSLDRARAKFPDGRWIEADLTSDTRNAALIEEIRPYLPAVIVVSDVIEHLPDVRPLLSLVRRLLALNENSRAVVSTPDRTRLPYADELSAPANPAHVREWALEELVEVLRQSGFVVEKAGNTRANQFDEGHTTNFVQVGFSGTHYHQALRATGLASGAGTPERLLITTELHEFGRSGGIGSFVSEQRRTYGPDNCLILFLGHAPEPQGGDRVALTPQDLLDPDLLRSLPVEDQALAALEQVLFYLPGLKSVEYQEYAGIGCRIAQAAAAGLLPPTLRAIVHCHGATHYLENGQRGWLGQSHAGVAEREKIAIEASDAVIFPSRFLRELYAQAGIRPAAERTHLRPYPYSRSIDVDVGLDRVDTLVFFGKRTRMKGFDLAVAAFLDRPEDWQAAGVTNLEIIGPAGGETSVDEATLQRLRETFSVREHTDLNRDDALRLIGNLASRSVVLMPYLADNQPISVLDAISANALPMLVAAGGLPELIPHELAPHLLAEPNPKAFRAGLLRLIALSGSELSDIRRDLARRVAERQAANREAALALPAPRPAPDKPLPAISVVVPFFNTAIPYVRELLWAIDHQTYPAHEVIIVDDASGDEPARNLDELLGARPAGRTPIRVVRHEHNKGLSGARNTGMHAATGDVLVNIDSDDVPLSHFLFDIATAFQHQPAAAAIVPYLSAFPEGDDFNKAQVDAYVYRPLGDGVTLSLNQNLLGHANAGFRLDLLRELGGWDETSRAMWEDYALYMRLVSSGRRIGVVPRVGCLYRSRPASMARTYDRWPAMRRIAMSIDGLPRFDAFRLEALAYEAVDLRDRLLAEASAREEKAANAAAARIARLQLVVGEERRLRAEDARARESDLAAAEARIARLEFVVEEERRLRAEAASARESDLAAAEARIARLSIVAEAERAARLALEQRYSELASRASVRIASGAADRIGRVPMLYRPLRFGARILGRVMRRSGSR